MIKSPLLWAAVVLLSNRPLMGQVRATMRELEDHGSPCPLLIERPVF